MQVATPDARGAALRPPLLAEAALEQRALASKPHFALMDALRGVAALAVVLLHSFERTPTPNAHLAVDLFFILSGFVIAYSYDDRLTGNMRIGTFLTARFIRLYPMLFVGALGGLAIGLIHNATNPAEAYPLGSILASGMLSLFALPYLQAGTINEFVFSFNPVLWSLFFELTANLVYALCARRLSVPVLTGVTLIGLAGAVACGPLGGQSQPTFWAGFPRMTMGFFGGVLLFKLWRNGALPRISGRFWPLAIILAALFALPIKVAGWLIVPVFALLWLVVLAAAGASPTRQRPYHDFLGLVSYPVYVVHWLTLYVFTFVGRKLGLVGDLYTLVAAVHLLAIPFIAYAFARWYETPLRLALKRALSPEHSRGAQPTMRR